MQQQQFCLSLPLGGCSGHSLEAVRGERLCPRLTLLGSSCLALPLSTTTSLSTIFLIVCHLLPLLCACMHVHSVKLERNFLNSMQFIPLLSLLCPRMHMHSLKLEHHSPNSIMQFIRFDICVHVCLLRGV